MTKKKKIAVITNVCIALVLIGLGIAVFTVDLSDIFISVGAPVSSGSRTGSEISLMFVVEDDSSYLNEIMTALKSKGIPATFFIGGNWASKNRDTVKQIAEDFEIGNHAYYNQSLAKLKEADQYNEIANCHSMIYTITSSTQITVSDGEYYDEDGNPLDGVEAKDGVEMNLFLPPNGSFNKKTLKCAEKLGYRTVMWSVDATNGSIYDKATAVRGGDFVLLKPSLATYSSLNNILVTYQRQNLTPVSVSQNIA